MSIKSSKSSEQPEAKKNEVAEEKLDKVTGGRLDALDKLVTSANLEESSGSPTLSTTFRRKR